MLGSENSSGVPKSQRLSANDAECCGWILALLEGARLVERSNTLYPLIGAEPARFLAPLCEGPAALLVETQLARLTAELSAWPDALSAEESGIFWQAGYWPHIGRQEVTLRLPSGDADALGSLITARAFSTILCVRAMLITRDQVTRFERARREHLKEVVKVQVDSVVSAYADKILEVKIGALLRAAAYEEARFRLAPVSHYYIHFDTLWQNSADRFAGPFPSRQDAEAALVLALNDPDGEVWMDSNLGGANIKQAIRIYGVVDHTQALEAGLREAGMRGYNILPRIPRSVSDLFHMERPPSEREPSLGEDN